jgi:hypothetical protein
MPILFPLQRRALFTNQRSSAKGVGPFVAKKPMPTQPPIVITGVTRDSAGVALANCALNLFRSDTEQLIQRLTSDGSGNFTTNPVGLGIQYQIDAYKVGSPDVAGTTLNTLTGA